MPTAMTHPAQRRWRLLGAFCISVPFMSAPFMSTVFISALLLSAESLANEQPSLTDVAGDARRGRAVFLDRQGGHCLLCHQLSAIDDDFQGTIGPSLDGVASRLSDGQLRYRIVDPTRLNPITAMPAYHRLEGFSDVAPAYRGQPVLNAQQVEDLIAYLRKTAQ